MNDSPVANNPRSGFYNNIGLVLGQVGIAIALYVGNFILLIMSDSTEGGETAFWGSFGMILAMPALTMIVSFLTFIVIRRKGRASGIAFLVLTILQGIGLVFIRQYLRSQ